MVKLEEYFDQATHTNDKYRQAYRRWALVRNSDTSSSCSAQVGSIVNDGAP
jgi:hypothetical protein